MAGRAALCREPEKICTYWTRQWAEIDPHVTPATISAIPDGRVSATVHQVVKDLQGNPAMNATLHQAYSFTNGLISSIEMVN